MDLKLIGLSLILLGFVSCKPEKVPEVPKFIAEGGYFVCNEGNFTFGNASLSHISDLGLVTNQVFASTNTLPVGDVLQSANLINDDLYLVVNNSGKIWVCNPSTLELKTTITGLSSPRYVVATSDSTAIVSDLESNFLTELNTQNHQITRQLDIGGSSEDLIVSDGFLYTQSWSGDQRIHKIDLQLFEKVGEIEVGASPVSMFLDHNAFLFIACQGGVPGTDEKNPAQIVTLDLTAWQITDTYTFPEKQSAIGSLNVIGDSLYFIANTNPWNGNAGGLFGLNKNQLSAAPPLVDRGNRLFYNYFFDSETGQHIICDAKDYLQPGEVLFYGNNFQFKASHEVSVIPNHIIKLP